MKCTVYPRLWMIPIFLNALLKRSDPSPYAPTSFKISASLFSSTYLSQLSSNLSRVSITIHENLFLNSGFLNWPITDFKSDIVSIFTAIIPGIFWNLSSNSKNNGCLSGYKLFKKFIKVVVLPTPVSPIQTIEYWVKSTDTLFGCKSNKLIIIVLFSSFALLF